MIVLPGDQVNGKSGFNTYESEGKVYASCKGYLQEDNGTSNVVNEGLAIPLLNDIIIGKCIFMTRKTAHIEIVLVERNIGNEVLKIPIFEEYKGILRHVDVQEFERDSVVMQEKLRLGDIVRGCVISYGDNAVYLSTAHKYLGVLHAMKNGQIMSVINQEQVQCPITGEIESRKLAIADRN
eukprot:NODE_1335_length_1300_cov_0.716903.p1 type:complete len:181 gc:universal NODE_1335_length_1300_cov_0.716903:799-257(-)